MFLKHCFKKNKGDLMKKLSLSLLTAISLLSQKELLGVSYESYLESWDSNWQHVVENLPPGPGGTNSNSYAGVTLNIGFGCYSFPGLNGLQFSTSDVATVVSYVHSKGGKARISFGGASYAAPCAPNYFISQTSGWPNNYEDLAAGVLSVVSTYDFDGVDFDIEDTQPGSFTPQQFATDLITFLKQVKRGLPAGKTLSITIPGQGWSTYWYYLATGVAANPGLVDYISFMEYDIWVSPSTSYAQQIQADLITYSSPTNTSPGPNYSPGWGIPFNMIQLGLMPGCADNAHLLSVTDAQSLAAYAVAHNLYGVMTWDLNRDSGSVQTPSCSTYPSNYQYSVSIRNVIGSDNPIQGDPAGGGLPANPSFRNFRPIKGTRPIPGSYFMRQPVPAQGSRGP